jgi:tetratricopeptide (TPR) repeat protein
MAALTRGVELRLGVRRSRAQIRQLTQAGAAGSDLAQLGEAYLELGEQLSALERFPPAVEAFAAAAERLAEAGETRRATEVRVRLVAALMVLGRREEALANAEAVIAAGEPTKATAEATAMAALWRVIALAELGREREALSGARRLIKRYGPGTTERQRQVVAKARLAESQLALRCGDPAAARRAADLLVSTYRDDPRADIQALVAEARAAITAATEATAPEVTTSEAPAAPPPTA